MKFVTEFTTLFVVCLAAIGVLAESTTSCPVQSVSPGDVEPNDGVVGKN
jgi:hypothetical protein